MSKYNHMKSIPIESIPKDEIKRAISEWAEGDKSLENLLWICYEKDLKTSGSHAGPRPFIDFKYQEDLNRIVCLFEKVQTIKGSDIFIQIDGGNPFSGDDFDKAFISLGNETEYEDEAHEFFDSLSETLKNNMDNKKDHPMLKMLNTLNDKGTSLRLRFKYNKDNTYEFSIESSIINDERYKYYSNIFKKANMQEEKMDMFDNTKRYDWKIQSDNLEDLLEKMNNISDIIKSDFKLEAETDEEKIIDFTLLAKYKKQNLSKNEFDNWLKEERKELFESKKDNQTNDKPLKLEDREKEIYPELKEKQSLQNQKKNQHNITKTLSNPNGFLDILFGSIITIIIGIIVFLIIR